MTADGCQATERHQQLETESAAKVGMCVISLHTEFWTISEVNARTVCL